MVPYLQPIGQAMVDLKLCFQSVCVFEGLTAHRFFVLLRQMRYFLSMAIPLS